MAVVKFVRGISDIPESYYGALSKSGGLDALQRTRFH